MPRCLDIVRPFTSNALELRPPPSPVLPAAPNMSEMNRGKTSNIKNAPYEGSIFTRIRTFNNHAFNSLGSLFSSSDHVNPDEQRFDNDDDDIHNQHVWDPASGLVSPSIDSSLAYDEPTTYPANDHLKPLQDDLLNLSSSHTPTPSRPVTPQDSNRLSDVKRIFSLGRNRRPTMSQFSLQPALILSEPGFYDFSGDPTPLEQIPKSRPPMLDTYSSVTVKASDSSDIDDTPPLSPDMNESLLTYSLSSFGDLEEFERDLDTRRHSLEVREGKKPERPVCFDRLIEDVASDNAGADRPEDNDDGWYGLEYTLELSVKERRASETYSYDETAGEFSKSHESWAALRKGTIHPFLEDDDYYQWKNWHRYLDHEDERRKHRKALEFKAHSKDMAWLYLAEMKARDVYYWQLVCTYLTSVYAFQYGLTRS
ncbi:hypothetical protein AAF712_010499 [Marasmius tenuissimus]|uniref:Uncharacterized protein n=1 Tax=Marasmius tenuissimus TaxID=585030 RepID=A0ABR2ZNB3_9AGAR